MSNLQVKDICDFMESWAPPQLAYPWDRIGLQIGRPDAVVNRAIVCLTVTPEAVDAARNAGASMIIAHHPMIWEPLTSLRGDNPLAALCIEMARYDMACFAAHTNLDIAPGGVNDALADALGLRDARPLFAAEHLRQVKVVTFAPESHRDSIRDALAAAGAGVIGDYTHCAFNTAGMGTFMPGAGTNPYLGAKGNLNTEAEWRIEMVADKARLSPIIKALYKAHPYEEPAYDIIPLETPVTHVGLGIQACLEHDMAWHDFVRRVADALGPVRSYGHSEKPVRTVAALGGSGGSYVERVPADADVFVTGDISYHEAQSALLRGLPCIDAGHAGTEIPIVDVIAKRLRDAFPHLAVECYKEPSLDSLIRPST